MAEYKGVQYQIVQTANPRGFRWTIQLDESKTRTGTAPSRNIAIFEAKWAIDKELKNKKAKQGRLSWRPLSFQFAEQIVLVPGLGRCLCFWLWIASICEWPVTVQRKKPSGRYAERLSHAAAGPALLRFRRICA
jgi:hypothetical protein